MAASMGLPGCSSLNSATLFHRSCLFSLPFRYEMTVFHLLYNLTLLFRFQQAFLVPLLLEHPLHLLSAMNWSGSDTTTIHLYHGQMSYDS